MGEVPGSRRDARERALDLLYEAEMKGMSPSAVLDALPVPADPYTEAVVRGVEKHLDEIDVVLRRFARNWDLDRMPAVDRAILRLATYELARRDDVPAAVVINEAVELAKTFSTDNSGPFVNGMLSAVAAELRPPT